MLLMRLEYHWNDHPWEPTQTGRGKGQQHAQSSVALFEDQNFHWVGHNHLMEKKRTKLDRIYDKLFCAVLLSIVFCC